MDLSPCFCRSSEEIRAPAGLEKRGRCAEGCQLEIPRPAGFPLIGVAGHSLRDVQLIGECRGWSAIQAEEGTGRASLALSDMLAQSLAGEKRLGSADRRDR